MTLREMADQLQAKRAELADLFTPFKGEDGSLGSMPSEKIEEARKRNQELSELHDAYKALEAVDEVARENAKALEDARLPHRKVGFPGGGDGATLDPYTGAPSAGGKAAKSLGDYLIESAAYKAFNPSVPHSRAGVEIEGVPGLKATLTSSGLTGYDRQAGIVLVGTQRLTVADLFAQGTTTQPVIRYVQEDSFTNAATTVAEGAAKPEATFVLSEVDAPVRKIAVTAKVTDEMFSDFPAIRSYVNERLRFMVEQREEAQLVSGDGTAPNISGVLDQTGIQTQAKGADPTPDAFYKAMTKIRTVGFFEPDAHVIHPNDWQDIRLLRTADGIYIWGSPTESGQERLWGLPVVVTTAITEGTGLVGAWKLGGQVFRRNGITLEMTNSNEDDFEKNLVTIRAEERLALAIYRPKAWCQVTGI